MVDRELQQRWSEDDTRRVAEALRAGGEVAPLPGPFGTHDGRADLRGFRMPAPVRASDCRLRDVDLTAAELTPLWMERCRLENVVFDRARLDDLSDHGNEFVGCRFDGASLAGARLGYEGSRYRGCVFRGCKFRNAGGIRAEFAGCRFTDCKLEGVDFEASSFEDCAFEGRVRDVWFRGGYPYPGYERKFGTPRKNRMANVSFADAELEFLVFSDGCDLSTVTLPRKGDYRKYDHWPQRLLRLQAETGEWPEPDKSEALRFTQVFLPGADGQEWMIIGVDDVRRHIAPCAAARIIAALDRGHHRGA